MKPRPGADRRSAADHKIPAEIARSLFAALPLINRHGLDGVSVAEIAEAAGIPRATLYYHFNSRDAILRFLLADVVRRMDVAVHSVLELGGTGRAQLEAIVGAQAKVVADDVDAFSVLIANLGRAGRVPEIAEAIDEVIRRPVAVVIRKGVADGSLVAVDPDLAAVAIYALVTTLAVWRDARGKAVKSDELAARVRELIVGGLAAGS